MALAPRDGPRHGPSLAVRLSAVRSGAGPRASQEEGAPGATIAATPPARSIERGAAARPVPPLEGAEATTAEIKALGTPGPLTRFVAPPRVRVAAA